MAATHRSEEQMKMEIKKRLTVANDPMERLRLQCLSRGCAGIKSLARQFQIIDDDGNRKLSMEEFEKGVHDFGASLDKKEIDAIFNKLDVDESGSIDFEEFLVALRPPMSISRQNIVNMAFAKLDRTGDGVVRIDDLAMFYKVDRHPKYISGESTKEQILGQFLDTFQLKKGDNEVTRDDFLNYYSGVSASIDSDIYFDLMMRTAWKL